MCWAMVGCRGFIKVGFQLGEEAEKMRFWLGINRKESHWGHTPLSRWLQGWQEDIPIPCCPAARRQCRGRNIGKRRPPADDPAAAHTGNGGGATVWIQNLTRAIVLQRITTYSLQQPNKAILKKAGECLNQNEVHALTCRVVAPGGKWRNCLLIRPAQNLLICEKRSTSRYLKCLHNAEPLSYVQQSRQRCVLQEACLVIKPRQRRWGSSAAATLTHLQGKNVTLKSLTGLRTTWTHLASLIQLPLSTKARGVNGIIRAIKQTAYIKCPFTSFLCVNRASVSSPNCWALERSKTYVKFMCFHSSSSPSFLLFLSFWPTFISELEQ